MLDDRVRAVLARLEEEDDAEQEAGLRPSERSLAVGRDSGRLLFALVAPNAGCEVLEIGGSRGYSAIWLAAAARILGGRVVSLEQEPVKIEAWQRNIAEAGLEEWAELVEGDAREMLPQVGDGFDVVFIDAWKDDYEWYFGEARDEARPWRRRRCRQRGHEPGGEGVCGGAPGRPLGCLGDRPDRERARGHHDPALTRHGARAGALARLVRRRARYASVEA